MARLVNVLRKNLNRLSRFAIHSASSDFATLCLDHLLDGPWFALILCEPREVVSDQVAILAAWTLDDDDTVGVGSF